MYKFNLDACASWWNAKCPEYYALPLAAGDWPRRSGLVLPWCGRSVWCNPPYARGHVGQWAAKCASVTQMRPATRACLLVQGALDTIWWHEWVMPYAHTVWAIKGRHAFTRRGQATAGKPPFCTVAAVFDSGFSGPPLLQPLEIAP